MRRTAVNPKIDPVPDHDDDDQASGQSCDEMVDAAIDFELQQRLWIRTALEVIKTRTQESDPSPRVQLAFDLMQIAAAERIARLMGTDLAADHV
jgi:hypothetical protein